MRRTIRVLRWAAAYFRGIIMQAGQLASTQCTTNAQPAAWSPTWQWRRPAALQHKFLRAVGLATMREPEEAAPQQLVCIPTLVSFRKTIRPELGRGRNVLFIGPSHGGPECLFAAKSGFDTHLTVKLAFARGANSAEES